MREINHLRCTGVGFVAQRRRRGNESPLWWQCANTKKSYPPLSCFIVFYRPIPAGFHLQRPVQMVGDEVTESLSPHRGALASRWAPTSAPRTPNLAPTQYAILHNFYQIVSGPFYLFRPTSIPTPTPSFSVTAHRMSSRSIETNEKKSQPMPSRRSAKTFTSLWDLSSVSTCGQTRASKL